MKLRAVLLTGIISLSLTGAAFAHCGTCGVGEPKAAAEEGTSEKHLMAEKTCPCGHALPEDETKISHAEHNGKTYHFCSLECAEKFKADPDAAIKMMEEHSDGQES
jgi:YHS domain-containing protein